MTKDSGPPLFYESVCKLGVFVCLFFFLECLIEFTSEAIWA